MCFCFILGTKFKRVIQDEGPASKIPGTVERVIFCTGKVYYELAKERKQLGLENRIAIVRLEQVTCHHLLCAVQDKPYSDSLLHATFRDLIVKLLQIGKTEIGIRN